VTDPPIETAERALAVARTELARTGTKHQFVVDESRTIEKPFGWVFFYHPARFLQSRDPAELVPGATPLVVWRGTGRTMFLSSHKPPHMALAELEQRWNTGWSPP
jgi:hypothetical protein